MEIYKAETEEILQRFLDRRLTREKCVGALYTAFLGILPDLKPEDFPAVRTIILANEEVLTKERQRRRDRLNDNSRAV